VSSERLSDWCDLSAGALRTTISRLRKIVGADIIFQEPPGYVLRTRSLDTHDFERLVEESRSAGSSEALARLDAALALWNGDALADFADQSWAQATAISLSELRASAIEDRAEILLRMSRWADAIVAMELHIAHYPVRDRPRGLLMRALAADGRQTEALRSYQIYRHYLSEEVGTEPSSEVRALEAKIATGWHERVHAVPGNLGLQTTSFVGRDTEVKEVAELVRQHRLVTLTGVGGVGKTRLAVQVAAELAPEFDDGVWLVELGPVGDPRSVPDAVATALGVTVQPTMSVAASVAEALAGRRVLVILDNCEHLLDASACLIEAILKTSTTASLIATSREGMRVGGEHLWPVPSLGIDEGADSAAVQLFVERAEQVNPAFSLHTDGGVDAVIEICRRLDGIALAIELAAARMVSMTPVEVSARLDDRFRLLSGSRRGLERHQTLRHAVQWSYDLLTPDEQVLLGVCAIFAGGFDLAAVSAVGEQFDEYGILDGLDSLVRKSLVAIKQVEGRTRYWVLETIRHFAEDQHATASTGTHATGTGTAGTVEIDEIRNRHVRYFASQAVAQFAMWDGPRMSEAADWLEMEFDNLRAGFRWASERSDLASAVAIAAHTPMIAFGLQRLEPVGWAEELLPAATAAQASQLPRLSTAASLCSYIGRPADALAYALSASALQTDPNYQPFDSAWVRFREAVAQLDAGRPDRYLEICTELAAQPGLAHVIGLCGLVAFLPSVGRADEAMSIAEDAMAAANAHANPYWVAFAHVGYGRALAQADPVRAMDKFREGLAYAREHPIPYWEAVFAREAGGLEAVHGDPEQALDLLSTSLDSFHKAGNKATLAWTLASLAVLFERTAHPEIAATLAGATTRYPIADFILGFTTAVERLSDTLDADSFDGFAMQGAAMDLTEAVHYAHAHINQARRQLATDARTAFDAEGTRP
jgi:predicted ATPase/DNA-binding SARP family transcriptional activator